MHFKSGLAATLLATSILWAGGGASAAQVQACRAFTFPVYFAKENAILTPAAVRVLRATTPRIVGCRVVSAKISVRADGKAAALNQRRAEAVSAAMIEAGVPANAIEIDRRGTSLRLLQRRVIVSMDLKPR